MKPKCSRPVHKVQQSLQKKNLDQVWNQYLHENNNYPNIRTENRRLPLVLLAKVSTLEEFHTVSADIQIEDTEYPR